MALSVSSRASKTIRAVAFLTVAGLFAMPGLAKAQEETWTQTNTIPIPGLASFDISFIETASHTYLLADRSNKIIDQISVISRSQLPGYEANFVGTALTSTGTVSGAGG